MIMPRWVTAWHLSPTHTSTQSNQLWAGTHIAAAPEARGLTSQDTVAAGHISAELYTHMSRHGWKPECAFRQCQSVFFFLSFTHSHRHKPTCDAHTCSHADNYSITAIKLYGNLPGGKQTFSLVPPPFLDRWWTVSWGRMHHSHHTWTKAPGVSLLLLQYSAVLPPRKPQESKGGKGWERNREGRKGRVKKGRYKKKTTGSKKGGREGGWEPDAWAHIYLSCQIIWQALQGGVYN